MSRSPTIADSATASRVITPIGIRPRPPPMRFRATIAPETITRPMTLIGVGLTSAQPTASTNKAPPPSKPGAARTSGVMSMRLVLVGASGVGLQV
jgi:hypothetical protein